MWRNKRAVRRKQSNVIMMFTFDLIQAPAEKEVGPEMFPSQYEGRNGEVVRFFKEKDNDRSR